MSTRKLSLALVGDYPNQCGECTECCEALGVSELGKPYGCRCEHQTDTGCANYQGRPEECKDYFCAWLAGFIPGDQRRPDKLGILFSHDSDTIAAHELRPGALDSITEEQFNYMVSRINQNLPKSLPVTFIEYGTRRGTKYEIDNGKYPGHEQEYGLTNQMWVNNINGDRWITNEAWTGSEVGA